VKLEIAVNEEFVEPTIEAILKGADRRGGEDRR
jgi:nitrogen regulatory protein PII